MPLVTPPTPVNVGRERKAPVTYKQLAHEGEHLLLSAKLARRTEEYRFAYFTLGRVIESGEFVTRYVNPETGLFSAGNTTADILRALSGFGDLRIRNWA